MCKSLPGQCSPDRLSSSRPRLVERQDLLLFRLVDVVSDHAAEYATYNASDDRTFHFILARHRANNRTCRGADLCITLCVFHNRPT